MNIDMHVHVLGNGRDFNNIDNDVYLNFEDNHHWFTRLLSNLLEEDLKKAGAEFEKKGEIATDKYFELLISLLRSSEMIDGIVLLGMDAVYSSETGEPDEKRTDLCVSNRFLHRKVRELNDLLSQEAPGKKFFMGASVSPNRKDWESELDYVINETDAVLLKLIPSTQHIHMKDEKHKPFFEALAAGDMPLLCHVGPEYSFPEGIRNMELDSFRYLEAPLDCEVKVIAAHCATPVFPLVDKNEIKEFRAFMESANGDGTVRLWADTSALSLSTRIPFISEIVDSFPSEWLVHGTDFPIPIDGWAHLPWITPEMTPKEYIEIARMKNPLDRDVRIKRAHGFSDSILENAEKVLRTAG